MFILGDIKIKRATLTRARVRAHDSSRQPPGASSPTFGRPPLPLGLLRLRLNAHNTAPFAPACQPLGMAIWVRVSDTHWLSDSTGMGRGMNFYPRVSLVPDSNRDGYGTGIFSHTWVTRRVPDNLLPL
jgi:hypothetical protein